MALTPAVSPEMKKPMGTSVATGVKTTFLMGRVWIRRLLLLYHYVH